MKHTGLNACPDLTLFEAEECLATWSVGDLCSRLRMHKNAKQALQWLDYNREEEELLWQGLLCLRFANVICGRAYRIYYWCFTVRYFFSQEMKYMRDALLPVLMSCATSAGNVKTLEELLNQVICVQHCYIGSVCFY